MTSAHTARARSLVDGEPTPRFGLRARLVGLVLAVLVVLLVSMAALVVWRATDALDDVDRARIRAATTLLAETLATGTLARSEVLLAPPLAAFATTPELLEVVVLDDAEQVLAARRVALPAPGEGQLTVRVPIVAKSALVDDDMAAFGIEERAPREVGVVVATFARRATADVEAGMRRDFVALFLTLGGLGLLFVVLLADSVVRRLRRIADAARDIASGDLEARIDDEGDDELSALARDFDRMADALVEERRALEQASLALADKESLAAIGRATAVIAHELKNPLGIVLGAAEVVQNEARSDEQRRRAAAIVVDEVKRLDHTLRQLLAGARPRTLSLERACVGPLVETVRARLLSSGDGEGALDVVLDVPDDTPDVRVDRAQTEEIVLNLLLNAREAGARRVTMTAEHDAKWVRLLVADDGPGIDARVRARLFAPFVTTKTRGTGLGLSASRRTAREQGGELALDDAHHAGARFVLTLARHDAVDVKETP